MEIEKKYFLYVFIGALLVIFIQSMWNYASIYSEDRSTEMQSYVLATHWLSNNLKKDETVFLPVVNVFLSIDSSLADRTIKYMDLWDSSQVILQSNTTDAEVIKVRQQLKSTIHHDKHIKYLVLDWVDPYETLLFQKEGCESFGDILVEVKVFPFITPHDKWRNKITICEVLNTTK